MSIPNLKGRYYDLSNLFSLTDGKTDILKLMIDMYIAQVEEFQVSVSAALENQDRLEIRKCSHKFKSSLSVLGILSLVEYFDAIHCLCKEEKDIKDIEQIVSYINDFCSKSVMELVDFRKMI